MRGKAFVLGVLLAGFLVLASCWLYEVYALEGQLCGVRTARVVYSGFPVSVVAKTDQVGVSLGGMHFLAKGATLKKRFPWSKRRDLVVEKLFRGSEMVGRDFSAVIEGEYEGRVSGYLKRPALGKMEGRLKLEGVTDSLVGGIKALWEEGQKEAVASLKRGDVTFPFVGELLKRAEEAGIVVDAELATVESAQRIRGWVKGGYPEWTYVSDEKEMRLVGRKLYENGALIDGYEPIDWASVPVLDETFCKRFLRGFTRGDYLRWTRSKELGDPAVQCVVAGAYMEDRLYGKAKYWYEKAAGLGFPMADYYLGAMYYGGMGVEKSLTKAGECLENAICHGLNFDEAKTLDGMDQFFGWATAQY